MGVGSPQAAPTLPSSILAPSHSPKAGLADGGGERMEVGDRGLAGPKFAKTERSQLSQAPTVRLRRPSILGATESTLMGVSQGTL